MSGGNAKSTGAAGRYANALFELAREAKATDAVEADLKAFAAILEGNDALSTALSSPTHDAEQKTGVLNAIADKADFHKLTRNAFAVAARNGRAGELGELADAFAAMADAERGVSQADVRSADKLSAKDIEALSASLKRALGRDVEIRTEVDPELLGGLIVQVGSRMFDSSLRTKLEGLRNAMKEA
ncbi:F0F1 ATP synthase subunit delta [Hyphobacterium marinum]|uniref:ATP synthase subunit delta n=1 Tax=Hyphobacterium marinum TaxID=3116574 RepID=A0ABU7LVQ5_9PROT|nr:F0F1 ATP synthase subunit delta [Hyphobacterium sp. Y6023]MEE2565632.1 F0F1 ATP synthase subunit delta [Hyphobacterium sp. Y6023]